MSEPMEVEEESLEKVGKLSTGSVSTKVNGSGSKEEWEIDLKTVGKIKYNVTTDILEVEEKLYWLHSKQDPDKALVDLKVLLSWRKTKPTNTSMLNDTTHEFISSDLYNQLYQAKSALKMSPEQLQDARLRSNVFEKIKGGKVFINRAAMKMANLDAILGFQITDPNSGIPPNCKPLVEKTEPLFFADICAGPGGFSEYFLWRKGWECKGFGFTLKGDNDFDLDRFVTGTENFEPHYGDTGDGNIKDPENVNSFIKFVFSNTDGKGVHFVTADGGIAVTGQESLQEYLTKDIFLAQILMGLALIRPGGHFICKAFDIFSPFSIGLVYLLYNCFAKFCIHKPNTSRPANSERYLICQYKKEVTSSVQRYLSDCLSLLWKNAIEDGYNRIDITELVPIEFIKEKDPIFLKYIYNSNNRLAIRQVLGLQKLLAFYKDKSLVDPRQADTKVACLDYWQVNCEVNRNNKPEFPKEKFEELKGNCSTALLSKPEKELTPNELCQINSPFDWRVVVVGGNSRKRGIYFGLGGARNYILDNNVWRNVQIKFQLVKNTIVYGEIVDELIPNSTKTTKGFHIIDGLFLGGQDIRELHFIERHALCVKFSQTMNKTTCDDLIPVRTKLFMRLENINTFQSSLVHKDLINEVSSGFYSPNNTNGVIGLNSVAIKPTGLLFLKITADPWMMAFSKKAQMKYWFNTMTKSSTFELPKDASADFKHTMENRLFWPYNDSSCATKTRASSTTTSNKIVNISLSNIDKYVQDLISKVVTE